MNVDPLFSPNKSNGYNSNEFVFVIPNAEDPCAFLAGLLCEQHAQTLPDLNHCVILIPNLQAGAHSRHCILEQGQSSNHRALLGPRINTLRAWIEKTTSISVPVLSEHDCKLMLVEALKDHGSLFGESNPWALADSLIALFEELTLHQFKIPVNSKDFNKQLASAYGLQINPHSALTREATLIHTLWHAWHKQQQQEGVIDSHAAYIAKLDSSLNNITADTHIYVLGYDSLNPAEIVWARALIERQQLTLVLSGDQHSPLQQEFTDHSTLSFTAPQKTKTSFTAFINSVFEPNIEPSQANNLANRANSFRATHNNSPASEKLNIYEASSAEDEARAIDIQIRQWLLAGKQNIGIVTEDRRLARRVRALLERANIKLQDYAGWALSTTSAAATLERWLEAIEEDFHHQPLMDVLKSCFIFPDQDQDTRLATCYRLEQDIILHENIASGLDRYRKHVAYRQNRLSWTAEDNHQIIALIDSLEFSAAPLLNIIQRKNLSSKKMFAALQESMQRIGMWQSFSNDDAGKRILQELELMHNASTGRDLRLSWLEFRTWIGRSLENTTFRPTTGGQVRLLSLSQTSLQRFDALIIAGATYDHMPGHPDSNPFFNDGVRHQLNIPLSRNVLSTRFEHFRRLLESAPVVLITLQTEQHGEFITPSPWVSALQTFHLLAYQASLHDNGLRLLVRHPDTQIIRSDNRSLPQPTSYPQQSVPADLLPQTITASMHQQLIDCPYAYYAAHCLKLKPAEEIREAMEKSDYGERVHRVLQAFHGGVTGLPGPFTETLRPSTAQAARDFLTKISKAEFSRDLEDNVIHRAWLKRWLLIIPDYINWQIKREHEWQTFEVETNTTQAIAGTEISIKGRLDRIDQGSTGVGIIDYKTGSIPNKQDVANGEAIQLPFYGLLVGNTATRVEYLKLDKEKAKTDTYLEGELLQTLKEKIADRLKIVSDEALSGLPFPAWGDEKTCSYCAMQGLCRKQAWTNNDQ